MHVNPEMDPSAAGLFMTVTTTNELSVDTSRGDQLQIHVSGLGQLLVICAHCAPQLNLPARLTMMSLCAAV